MTTDSFKRKVLLRTNFSFSNVSYRKIDIGIILIHKKLYVTR